MLPANTQVAHPAVAVPADAKVLALEDAVLIVISSKYAAAAVVAAHPSRARPARAAAEHVAPLSSLRGCSTSVCSTRCAAGTAAALPHERSNSFAIVLKIRIFSEMNKVEIWHGSRMVEFSYNVNDTAS
eukprot:SAG25_NODE_286_length_10355_cov_16.654544_7_plen_129_part_00